MKFTDYCTHSKVWVRGNGIKQTIIVTHYFESGLRFRERRKYNEDIKYKINKDINKLKQ